MSTNDQINLMEAYNSVILKETEDQAKQDPREGFPSHEEEKHEAEDANEHEFESSTNEPEKNEDEKSSSKWDETFFLRNNKTGEFYTYDNEEEAHSALDDYSSDEDWCLYKGDEEVGHEEHEEHEDGEADADALASAGHGTEEDYGGDEGNFGEAVALSNLYNQVLISEAKKGNNPFAICTKSVGKNKKKKNEKCVKGVKKKKMSK